MPYQNYYPYQQPLINQVPMSQPQRMAQMDLYPQFQQQQIYPQNQPQTPVGINGRIVDNISSVSINEVSSDNNSPSIFLKSDCSEVYLKKYNDRGLIETITFKRLEDVSYNKEEKASSSFESSFNDLQERLTNIEAKLNKALDSKPATTSTRGGAK